MNPKPKPRLLLRLLRWGLPCLAILITLLAVIVVEENTRARRAWDVFKREAEANGDPVDRIIVSPAVIPDEQNFAKATIIQEMTGLKWDEKKNQWESSSPDAAGPLKMRTSRTGPEGTNSPPRQGELTSGTFIDLSAWQEYYRHSKTNLAAAPPSSSQRQDPATDVLAALGKYDAPIEKLRQASLRPFSRFANYEGNDPIMMSQLFEYLSGFKGCYSVIQLRALAELAANQTNNAFDDTRLLLRLNDTLRQEPLLITHLMSLSTMNMALQPIYEGLAQHKWSDAQLAELEKALAQKDFLADYQMTMRAERSFAIVSLENMRLTGSQQTFVEGSPNNKVTTSSLRFTPSAFFLQNELATAQLHAQIALPLVDIKKRVISPAATRRAEVSVNAELKKRRPYRILALMTFPAVLHTVNRFASAQSYTDMARLGCAIERYRLANHSYPETLEQLAPAFIDKLPRDIINGEPFHYRRTEDSRFVLYSVGWNEKDDGGQIGLTKKGSYDREKGDWVWQYPSK